MENQNNPYRTPESNTEIAEEPKEIIRAGKGRRLLNFIIDYVMQFIIGFVIAILVIVIKGEEAINNIPDILIGIVALLIYYISMEGLFGRTVGKFITGTKVVNENGARPSFGQIVGRSFSRLIPFEAFSFLGEQTRGWHDSLPGTYVVRCR